MGLPGKGADGSYSLSSTFPPVAPLVLLGMGHSFVVLLFSSSNGPFSLDSDDLDVASSLSSSPIHRSSSIDIGFLCPHENSALLWLREKGLFTLAPPDQGIDGEWIDGSRVIVYEWNEKGNRLNTGNANWKKRWSCCQEYNENAPPCHRGWHVCFNDGYTLY
ncbi:hypothetical protein Syun_017454 [Stephania yunnanensis]|uniref:Uncharacterized protein n=1 Tax=Stephania yunnanensis TaxID=152371 RepID=A0AAP0J9A7_9MAGN